MFDNIINLLNIISEGGGAIVASDPPNTWKKPKVEDEDEDEDELDESLFKTKVHHGKIKKSRKSLGDVDNKIDDLHNKANLIKARFKAKTPKAKLNKKHSMLIRKRIVDRE